MDSAKTVKEEKTGKKSVKKGTKTKLEDDEDDEMEVVPDSAPS